MRVKRRRILLVDDEIAVLLTLKAVLEIGGFEVDTAASAKEGQSKISKREYDMIITDMRMESDASGIEVIKAARAAKYHPAVALLTAFQLSDEDSEAAGADKMLIKPMQTRILLQKLDKLLVTHQSKLAQAAGEPVAEITPPGDTQASTVTPIYARTSGYLRHWYADVGAHVRKGQLLADIETPELDLAAHEKVIAKKAAKKVVAKKSPAKKSAGNKAARKK